MQSHIKIVIKWNSRDYLVAIIQKTIKNQYVWTKDEIRKKQSEEKEPSYGYKLLNKRVLIDGRQNVSQWLGRGGLLF